MAASESAGIYLAERHQHVATLDLRLVARDLQVVGDALAGGDVVLPRVPRAGDDAALELALAERTAAVRAFVVDRVEAAVDVEQRQLLPLDGDGLARPGRDLRRRAGLHERG